MFARLAATDSALISKFPPHGRAQHRESGSQQDPRRSRLAMAEHRLYNLRPGKQLGVGRAAEVRSQLLVEELLEFERATPLRRIVRVEPRVRPAHLDRGDDSGRIADRATVEGQHRCRRGIPGQALGLHHVGPGKQRTADVGDVLVVKRPAHLLVVVRDLELPQHGEDQVFPIAQIDGGFDLGAEPARDARGAALQPGLWSRSACALCAWRCVPSLVAVSG